MKQTALSLLAGVTMATVVSLSACAQAPAGDDKAIAAKATELTAKSATRADKLVALQRFVRDDIREMPTNWG